uniref:Replication protein A2 n=1 Tax=Fundulus heteroclitus TaxID=8078 RepID=A0A3Q2NN59_FUNHE
MWNQGGYSETAMVGGYTQSPGGFASPTASQGGEKKGRTRATQIIPCTVSQLMSATQVEEAFKVGDVEVTQDPSMDTTVLPPGTYVKVSGNLRSFQNHRSVVAFSVRPLEDMNEITSHILEVVHAHMALSKPQTMVRRHSLTVSATLYLPKAKDQPTILRIIKSRAKMVWETCTWMLFAGFDQLSSTFLIYITVEFLSNEGHIFSTIDEDHFKSTDSED